MALRRTDALIRGTIAAAQCFGSESKAPLTPQNARLQRSSPNDKLPRAVLSSKYEASPANACPLHADYPCTVSVYNLYIVLARLHPDPTAKSIAFLSKSLGRAGAIPAASAHAIARTRHDTLDARPGEPGAIKEIHMNARLFAAAAAGLFAIAGAAQAQMTSEQQQLVQTMRPMQTAQSTQSTQSTQAARESAGMQAASTDDTSYGGTPASRSMSAPGHRQGSCSAAPNCDIFFGQ